jgi:peptide/nickel transport system substrate-binding protein
VIDAAGPWGTGPFTLTEGYSAIFGYGIAFICAEPFAATWLGAREDRAGRVVLEANDRHWNTLRGPRLQKVIYRNDLGPAEALAAICDREGEVDIVSEVSAADARRVTDSRHARLVAIDAMRILVAVVNRGPEAAPMDDVRVRKALNHGVDRDRLVRDVLHGYGTPLAGMTPPWAKGYPKDLQPYTFDPERARALLAEAGWPAGRALRLAAPPPLAGIGGWLQSAYRESLGIDVELLQPSGQEFQAWERALVEKKLPLPWDLLVHAWLDLSADVPPAVMHREFFHTVGGFRAGPSVPEFDRLFAEYIRQVDDRSLEEIGARLDQLAYDEALAVFLASAQALYAVNEHVSFVAHRATFELAETEVSEQHWSRR